MIGITGHLVRPLHVIPPSQGLSEWLLATRTWPRYLAMETHHSTSFLDMCHWSKPVHQKSNSCHQSWPLDASQWLCLLPPELPVFYRLSTESRVCWPTHFRYTFTQLPPSHQRMWSIDCWPIRRRLHIILLPVLPVHPMIYRQCHHIIFWVAFKHEQSSNIGGTTCTKFLRLLLWVHPSVQWKVRMCIPKASQQMGTMEVRWEENQETRQGWSSTVIKEPPTWLPFSVSIKPSQEESQNLFLRLLCTMSFCVGEERSAIPLKHISTAHSQLFSLSERAFKAVTASEAQQNGERAAGCTCLKIDFCSLSNFEWPRDRRCLRESNWLDKINSAALTRILRHCFICKYMVVLTKNKVKSFSVSLNTARFFHIFLRCISSPGKNWALLQDLVQVLSQRGIWKVPKKHDQASYARNKDGNHVEFEDDPPFVYHEGQGEEGKGKTYLSSHFASNNYLELDLTPLQQEAIW